MNERKFEFSRLIFFCSTSALILLAACGTSNTARDSSQQEQDIQLARGEQVYKQNCAACHATTPDTVIVGPSLAGIGTAAASRIEGLDAREYLQVAITEPDKLIIEGYDDIMPKNFGQVLSEEDLDSLVSYLLTLE
jgi:nitric oxide reductase subunit C